MTSPALLDPEHLEPEEPTTICDRCATETPVVETQNGPEGTQWEACTLCNDCYAEELP